MRPSFIAGVLAVVVALACAPLRADDLPAALEVAAGGCAASLPSPQLAQAPAIDAAARLLAGLPVAEAAEGFAVTRDAAWQRYSAQLERSFQRLQSSQLAPMTQWRERHIGEHPASHGPVYYPFSGPDLVYLLNLFPQADRFVLTGLEPVGDMPVLDATRPQQLQRQLRALSGSLYALLEFSFFRTNDLSANLDESSGAGVIPILMLFLERMDYQILAVQRFRLDARGQWCTLDERKMGRSDIAGVRIHFLRRGARVVKQLVYLSADIGDAGLARTPQYEAYVRAVGVQAVLYKSASYLPHKPYFSRIRALTLELPTLLLQDDSGVPWNRFDSQQWDKQVHGRYPGPIALFANMYQPDLSRAYEQTRPELLPFSYGYQHRKGSSGVMLMLRRDSHAP